MKMEEERISNVGGKKVRILVETLYNANLTKETLNDVYDYLDLLAEPVRSKGHSYMQYSGAVKDKARALEKKLDGITIPEDLKQIFRKEIGILKYDREMGLYPINAAKIALEYNLGDGRFMGAIEQQRKNVEKCTHLYSGKNKKDMLKLIEKVVKEKDKIKP